MKEKSIVRIRILTICIIVFAFLLMTKLYFVQIVQGNQFAEKADRQYIRPVGGVFNRGTIYFQNKDGSVMAAASLKTGYTIAINPKLLKNPQIAYDKLSAIIPLDQKDFITKANLKDQSYEEIAKRVDEVAVTQINALSITGINVYKEKWRYYPGETLAAHVLGFVGFKGDTRAGRYGLENYYDSTLERSSENVYVNFFAEIFSDIHKTLTDTGSTEGDITTTIEPTVQAYLEKQLEATNLKYKSKATGGIIINPSNGEIYAMGVTPTFDPNSFQTEKSSQIFTDPLVESVYEMGSIIKPLTMAAGLDAGVVTANTTYFDKGFLTLNGSTIYNYDKRGRGLIPMQEVLDESLNTGAAFVALKLGNQQFSNYMYKYGLGEKTGIDLPNEAQNLVDNLKSPRDLEHATASYGQGIALSPIATARALSVLGNGGTLIFPHIVKKIDYNVGYSNTLSFPQGPRAIQAATSHEITRMLVEVVDKALLNGTVKMDHYSIAAKTGTAQIAQPNGRGYIANQYLHSFFGYFPAYNPQFLVFLYTIEPQGELYASHTLTEPFINTAKFLINYYEVPPDR